MSRGFTDPFTSTVDVRVYDVVEQFSSPFRALPSRYLAPFLHETTHHWCLDTPVGLALAALRMRARRSAYRWSTNTSEECRTDLFYDALTDTIRSETLLELARPLAEGLALFCEHDAAPGESPVISIPMMAAATLFRRRDGHRIGEGGGTIAAQDLLKHLPETLLDARLSPAHIHRKADLLIQSLDAVQSPYLPGYLLVKNLHRVLIDRSVRFIDSDLFLNYCKSFFFEDWDLVDVLLDEAKSDSAAVPPIFEYFQRRLAALVHETDDEVVAAFERRGESGDMDEFCVTGASLELTHFSNPIAGCGARGKQRLSRLLKDLFDVGPADTVEEALNGLALATLSLRSSLTLGHAKFAARITEAGMLQVLPAPEAKIPLFACRASEALARPWKGSLTVDVVTDFSATGLYLFFSREGKLIHSVTTRPDGEIPGRLETPLIDRDVRRELVATADAFIKTLLADERSALVRDNMLRTLSQLNKVYLPRALLFVPDARLEQAYQWMQTDGWLGIPGSSIGLVQDMAALSVMASLRLTNRDAHGIEWSSASAAHVPGTLNDWTNRTVGYAPFTCRDGTVYFSLV